MATNSTKRRAAAAGPKHAKDLAALFEVSPASVSSWMGRDDWPVRKRGPWSAADVEKIAAWLESRRTGAAPAGGEPPDLARAYAQIRVLLYRERTAHEKVKREILEGQLIRRDAVDGALGGLAAMFVAALEDMELSLPGRLARKEAPEIERELVTYLDAARRRIVARAEYEIASVTKLTASTDRRRGRGRPAAASP